MSSSFFYTITGDFLATSTVDISVLQYEITENVIIVTDIDYIDLTGDNVSIYFNNVLSGPEITELNTLVATFTNIIIIPDNLGDLKVSLSETTDPLITDDSLKEYKIGSRWINIIGDSEWVCLDASVGAAIWKRTEINSHFDLIDKGSYTHTQVDTHIDDDTKHRIINDLGVSTTELWSSNKINTELSTLSNVGHTHTAAEITDFDVEVSNNTDVVANSNHRLNISNPHSVTAAQLGLDNIVNTKVNYTAIISPSVGNDNTEGYSIGSIWINVTNNKVYICVDASTGASIWVSIDITDHDNLSNIGINTHDQIDTHINDLTKHRIINDLGISNTDLWSADKINTELGSKSDSSHTHIPSDVGLSNIINIKSNYNGTTAPTVTDDLNTGYNIGSFWIDTINNEAYMCVDNIINSAVWSHLSQNVITDHTSLTNIGINTHTQIDSHISDLTKHRIINDLGISLTELWSSSKINTEIGTKANISHNHTSNNISDFDSSVDTRITLQKGALNGIASLDGSGKVPSTQLSGVLINSITVVADDTARNALSPSTGDVAKVTSSAESGNGPATYVWNGSSWIQILDGSSISSVNGQTGVVVLTAADIGLGNIINTKVNYTASGPPSINNDNLQGYNIGSTWIDETNDEVYVCVDDSTGAAIWVNTSSGTVLSVNSQTGAVVLTAADIGLGDVSNIKYALNETTGPTEFDDNPDSGYSVGSLWIDTTADIAYICVDASNDTAVWKSLTTSDVTSVNGQIGIVSLTKDDIGLNNLLNIKDNYTASVPPTVTDDGSPAKGYSIGSRWIDNTLNKYYVCVNNTIGSSIWVNLSSGDVVSVNGQTGIVVLTPSDLGLGNIVDTKVNYTATIIPSVGNDNTQGYSVGSIWVNVSNDIVYICVDDSTGAALWKDITSNSVDSVNGQTGTVVLSSDNISEGTTNLYYTETRVNGNTNVLSNTTHTGLTTGNPHNVNIDDVKPTSIKGQLIVDNGTNAVALNVGSDDQILVADSTTGSGITWKTPNLFGTEYHYIEDIITSNTTSTSFQEKLKLTTTNIPAGDYKISICYNWRYSDRSNDIEVRVELDDITELTTLRTEPTDGSSYQTNSTSAFAKVSLTSGNHTVDIDYRSTVSGKTASISHARIELHRIN